jgi:hypothetical protein
MVKGDTEAEAWRRALDAARSVGMLGRLARW